MNLYIEDAENKVQKIEGKDRMTYHLCSQDINKTYKRDVNISCTKVYKHSSKYKDTETHDDTNLDKSRSLS